MKVTIENAGDRRCVMKLEDARERQALKIKMKANFHVSVGA